jgi:hypothetical protein
VPPAPSWAFWSRAIFLVVCRPSLWSTAIRQAFRLARPGWWRRPPFLPLPVRDYLRFRFETQYGNAAPVADDVLTYLEWCRSMEP